MDALHRRAFPTNLRGALARRSVNVTPMNRLTNSRQPMKIIALKGRSQKRCMKNSTTNEALIVAMAMAR